MLSQFETKLQKTIESVKKHFSGVRTGHANPELLSRIMVDYYGSIVPLKQVAAVSIPEPTTFSINIFDKSAVKSVEKAILSSDLSLNPQVDGNVIRIRLPELTQERRKELVKLVKKFSEEGKVALRNLRREYIDGLKKQEKDKVISEDESKRLNDGAQKMLDQFVAILDQLSKDKESEILKV